jgi:GNAT superfamily N-acetyltransferase
MPGDLADLVVRDLTPDLLDDYLRFFDEDAFADNRSWSGCYCGFFHDSGTTWNAGPRAARKHREEQADRIRGGEVRGLLAYAGGSVIGWVNAGPRAGYANLRGFVEAVDDPNARVGVTMCFVVAPAYRGRGVATALLNAACAAFRRQGLAVAEGYPRLRPTDRAGRVRHSVRDYHGPLGMYLRAGYAVHRELGRYAVVRKQL